jgi:hypothetical protein
MRGPAPCQGWRVRQQGEHVARGKRRLGADLGPAGGVGERARRIDLGVGFLPAMRERQRAYLVDRAPRGGDPGDGGRVGRSRSTPSARTRSSTADARHACRTAAIETGEELGGTIIE